MPDAVPTPGSLGTLLAQVDAATALGAGGMMPSAFRAARKGSPLADGLEGRHLA